MTEKRVILYHGTIRTFAESIVRDGIDVRINEGTELDFGNGFYFSDRITASRLAVLKSKEREDIGNPNEDKCPAVIALEVDLDGLRTLKSLLFSKKDFRWFEFVFDARYKCQNTEYDFIEGPMADGAIDNIMKRYREKPSRLNKFIVWVN